MKKYTYGIFISAIALLLLGIVLVLSASSTFASIKHDDQFYLFNSHLGKAVIGFGILIAASAIPYEVYKNLSKWGMLLTLLLLLLVFILPSSLNAEKGVHRWISFPFPFQPADVARILLLIHLAVLLENKADLITDFKTGYMFPLTWIIMVSGLILAQPNVSTATVIFILGLMMLFVAGARIKHLFFTVITCLFLGGSAAMIFDHSRNRVLNFISSMFHGGEVNWQVKQAIYSFGSGGIFGVGFGHSYQRNLFLPEAYGDFIFAIVGEESGLVGSTIILAIYLLIFLFGVLIAKNATDDYGKFLAFGISITFVMYAFIHAGVALGVLPTTGLPLPLISHGGTSLWITCFSLGVLMNIGLSQLKNPAPQNIVAEPA